MFLCFLQQNRVFKQRLHFPTTNQSITQTLCFVRDSIKTFLVRTFPVPSGILSKISQPSLDHLLPNCSAQMALQTSYPSIKLISSLKLLLLILLWMIRRIVHCPFTFSFSELLRITISLRSFPAFFRVRISTRTY